MQRNLQTVNSGKRPFGFIVEAVRLKNESIAI